MIVRPWRKTGVMSRARFLWSKVFAVSYTIVWGGLVFATYEILDTGIVIKILLTAVLIVFAPTLGDITESYDDYKQDVSRTSENSVDGKN